MAEVFVKRIIVGIILFLLSPAIIYTFVVEIIKCRK